MPVLPLLLSPLLLVMGPPASSSLLSQAPAGVEIRGDIRCPTTGEVGEHLQPLLSGPPAELPPTDWLELRDVAVEGPGTPDLELRLARAGPEGPLPLGARRIVRLGSCAQTAEIIAVIAASWIGNYPTPPATLPLLSGVPSAPPSQDPSLEASSDASVDAPPAKPVVRLAASEAPETPAAGAPASLSSGQPPILQRQASSSRRPAAVFAVGAAGGVVSGPVGGVAPEIQAEGEVSLAPRFLLRLTATGSGSREIAINEARATWQRLTIMPSAAAVWRSPKGRFVELGGGALVAMTRGWGQGFATNQTDLGLELGLAPSARLGTRLEGRPLSIWLGATAPIWLRPTRAVVDGLPAGESSTVGLPWWELSIAAGVTFSGSSYGP